MRFGLIVSSDTDKYKEQFSFLRMWTRKKETEISFLKLHFVC